MEGLLTRHEADTAQLWGGEKRRALKHLCRPLLHAAARSPEGDALQREKVCLVFSDRTSGTTSLQLRALRLGLTDEGGDAYSRRPQMRPNMSSMY